LRRSTEAPREKGWRKWGCATPFFPWRASSASGATPPQAASLMESPEKHNLAQLGFDSGVLLPGQGDLCKWGINENHV
jgi:hypothetical protein